MQHEMPVMAGPHVTDEAAIALLHDLVAIPSPSGQEGEAARCLVDTMRSWGMNAYVDEVGNACGTIGSGQREIVLLGHIDTVEGNIPVRIEQGRLYGRGAVDAKGPLAAFVAAAASLRDESLVPGRVTVIGCVEEEAPSSRGAHAVLPRYTPDYCIIGEPSGVDTLTLGYKGSLRCRMRVVKEGGHSAHARQSAPEQAIELWRQIERWAEEANYERERAWNRVLPTLVGITSGGDGLAEWCELDLSIRLPEHLSPKMAESQLRQLNAEAGLEVLGAVPAFRSPRTSPLVRAGIQALQSEGLTPRFVVKTGTSDMNLAGPAWGCPIIAYGPGDSNLDHTPQEHIEIREYLQAIAVLRRLLRRLLMR